MSIWDKYFSKKSKELPLQPSTKEELISDLTGGRGAEISPATREYIHSFLGAREKVEQEPVIAPSRKTKVVEIKPVEIVIQQLPKIKLKKVEEKPEEVEVPQIYIDREYTPMSTAGATIGRYKIAQEAEYMIGNISVVAIVYAFLMSISLAVKYFGVDNFSESVTPFIIQNIMVIAFLLTGIGIHTMIINRSLKVGGFSVWHVALGGVGFIFATILQTTFSVFIKFAVSKEDLYYIFISLAVAEEVCFRLGFQTMIEGVVREFYDNKVVASIIGVVGVATIFAALHIFVYKEVYQLLSVFILGIIFGFLFAVPIKVKKGATVGTKNLDACIIAHLLTNIIAGINVIWGAG